MTKEELVGKFIKHWKKTNKDKFYDDYDVKKSLREFYYQETGQLPDFRNSDYKEIWLQVKQLVMKK